MLRSFEDAASNSPNPADSLQRTATSNAPVADSKTSPRLMRFASGVVLDKSEVLEACEWLATAEQVLLEDGHSEEASSLAVLFDQLEDRLTIAWDTFEPAPTRRASPLNSPLGYCFESVCSGFSGSNSSESELMQ